MSDNTIELLPIKPKRVYKRKPKEVVPECVAPHTTRLGGEPHSDSESSTTSLTPILSLEVPETQPKPKRSYSRKPKCVAPVVEPLVDPPTQTKSNIRLTTELIDTPPSSPVPVAEPVVKEKKQRTEKQIAAFNKMRDARLAKQEELNRLKELEKEEKRISSEKSKLDKVTEQVINKATEIKKKRASRKKEVVDECVEPHTTRLGGEPQFREPQQISIIKETKYKPILFV